MRPQFDFQLQRLHFDASGMQKCLLQSNLDITIHGYKDSSDLKEPWNTFLTNHRMASLLKDVSRIWCCKKFLSPSSISEVIAAIPDFLSLFVFTSTLEATLAEKPRGQSPAQKFSAATPHGSCGRLRYTAHHCYLRGHELQTQLSAIVVCWAAVQRWNDFSVFLKLQPYKCFSYFTPN